MSSIEDCNKVIENLDGTVRISPSHFVLSFMLLYLSLDRFKFRNNWNYWTLMLNMSITCIIRLTWEEF